MSKSSILLILLLLICVTIPFQAGASPARVEGLNLGATTIWMIGIDEVLFGLNPAILAELRPQVWGQITSTSPPFAGGIILSPSKSMNLYISTGTPLSFAGFAAIPAPPDLDPGFEQVRVGVSLAMGQIELGVSAMYTGMSTNDTPTAGAKHYNNVYDLGAGAIIILNPGSMNIDVAGDVKIWTIHREDTAGGVAYDALSFDITALGRLNWEIVQNNTFHILGGFAFLDRSYTPGAGAKLKFVDTNIEAGFSDEINFTDSIMAFAGGVFFMNINSTDANDVTTYSVNAVAGLEVAIIKEAIMRVGIGHQFWYMETDGDYSSTENATYATNFACGLGVRLGELLVDFELNSDLFLDGPNFISGAANNMAVNLVVTYFLGPSQGALK